MNYAEEEERENKFTSFRSVFVAVSHQAKREREREREKDRKKERKKEITRVVCEPNFTVRFLLLKL